MENWNLHKQDKTSDKTSLDEGFTSFNNAAGGDIPARDGPKGFLTYQYRRNKAVLEISQYLPGRKSS